MGYDIDLFNRLARELGVRLEFIPWRYDTLFEQLKAGDFDVAAGGLIVSTDRLAKVAFSESYMTVTQSLVVPDYRRNDFPTWTAVDQANLRIGLTGRERAERANLLLDQSEVVEVASYEDFFGGARTDLDAIAISAEAGSAWTVIHPEYGVAIPKPHVSAPIAIPMARGDEAFTAFLSDWLRLQKVRGTLDALYDKWILGKDAARQRPRWSIVRDVLHWVE